MIPVGLLLFPVGLPWGLLQEDEGFWTDEQEHLFQYNILLNQTLMYLPQAWGIPPLFSKPAMAYLGAYNAVMGGLLKADDLMEKYQRGEIDPKQQIEDFIRITEFAVNTTLEGFEASNGDYSINLKEPEHAEFLSDISEFAIMVTNSEICPSTKNGKRCILPKGHAGAHVYV